MREVLSAGGVILRHPREILMAEHHVRKGTWGFPKGHLEAGETLQEAAMREVAEETGFTVKILAPLGSLSRRTVEQDGLPALKKVELYRMCIIGRTGLDPEETLSWLNVDYAVGVMSHPEDAEFMRRVVLPLADTAVGEDLVANGRYNLVSSIP